MKPDWKKIAIGISIMLIVLITIVILDTNFRLIKILRSLPKSQIHLIGLSTALIFSIFGFLLAKKKGKNPYKWMFFCFLFNAWSLIFLWSLPENRKREVGKGSSAN